MRLFCGGFRQGGEYTCAGYYMHAGDHTAALRCAFKIGDAPCVGPGWHAGDVHQTAAGELFVMQLPLALAERSAQLRAGIRAGIDGSHLVLLDLHAESGTAVVAGKQDRDAAFAMLAADRIVRLIAGSSPYISRDSLDRELAGLAERALVVGEDIGRVSIRVWTPNALLPMGQAIELCVGEWQRSWTVPRGRFYEGTHTVRAGRTGPVPR